MTTDEVRAKTARDRERAILERADQIDNLMTAFIAELRVHTDLLRAEVSTRERAQDERAG